MDKLEYVATKIIKSLDEAMVDWDWSITKEPFENHQRYTLMFKKPGMFGEAIARITQVNEDNLIYSSFDAWPKELESLDSVMRRATFDYAHKS